MIKNINNTSFKHVVDLFDTSTSYYLVFIDNDINYAYLNNYFLEKFGLIYEGHEKYSAFTALHPDDYETANELNSNCRREPGKSFPIVLRKLNDKGGYTITQWDFKASVTTSGEVEGLIGVGYDITEFGSMEYHINQLSLTINQVAYKQSHVIRRPLANILGLIEVLNVSDPSPSTKKIIKLLRKSCKELSKEFDDFMIDDGIATITETEQPIVTLANRPLSA